ncbi:MAG TPA: peptidoglycan DD-metalloendopeptidase family protein, partial [Actinomycetota bacterium]|nr:peptidoglycan DD-metalloendopeptidase family protein [Actinomycetota bacterium]
MRANRGRSASYRRRWVGVAAASLLLLMALAPTAGAGLKQSLDEAKARLAELKRQIGAQQSVLDRLSAEAAAIGMQIDEHQAIYEQVTTQLQQTQVELEEARSRFQAVLGRLNERLREAFMQGAGSPVEFLLGATSLANLSDRLEFVDAMAQSDSDLADRVQNLRNELSAKARNQQRLKARQADILRALEGERAKLQAQFSQQKQIYDDIQDKRAEAEKLVERLGRAYRDFLASLSGVSNGVFKVCPVDQPRAVYDGFGAPRYSGGYHPHAGNDIIAPTGTAIHAPFAGVARSSYNTLGGDAVYVYGALGYVYNAHLSSYSANSNGAVAAGDVIGYVGDSGDALGGVPHDHFEWHPKVIPSDWPSSPYGYRVIGSAV